MELFLWRHAEAETAHSLGDLQRRLTERGERQARRGGRWLRTLLPENAKVLVSPAVRTNMTAHALGLPYELEPGLAPAAPAAGLLAAAHWPHGKHEWVVLVGHQPALGQAAALLLFGLNTALSIKKGAIWWFSSRERSGAPRTILRAVVTPELITKHVLRESG